MNESDLSSVSSETLMTVSHEEETSGNKSIGGNMVWSWVKTCYETVDWIKESVWCEAGEWKIERFGKR